MENRKKGRVTDMDIKGHWRLGKMGESGGKAKGKVR